MSFRTYYISMIFAAVNGIWQRKLRPDSTHSRNSIVSDIGNAVGPFTASHFQTLLVRMRAAEDMTGRTHFKYCCLLSLRFDRPWRPYLLGTLCVKRPEAIHKRLIYWLELKMFYITLEITIPFDTRTATLPRLLHLAAALWIFFLRPISVSLCILCGHVVNIRQLLYFCKCKLGDGQKKIRNSVIRALQCWML